MLINKNHSMERAVFTFLKKFPPIFWVVDSFADPSIAYLPVQDNSVLERV